MNKLTIDSKFVGVPWKIVERKITWRETTNYAAALSDIQDCYFNDLNGKVPQTHPMFPVTLGWPLIIDIEDYIDIPLGREIIGQLVHFMTYIDFHKMIAPPVDLVVKGQIALIREHRSGTEISFRFDVFDKEETHYHTEYMTCILRDVVCVGGDKNLPDFPEHPKNKFESTLWQSEAIKVAPELPYIYDGCSGIYNPIHTSPVFAASVGLPGVILQGTATIALGIREVIARELKGKFAEVEIISAKLNSMVLQGNELEVQLLDKKTVGVNTEFFFQIFNRTSNELAVTYGYLKIKTI